MQVAGEVPSKSHSEVEEFIAKCIHPRLSYSSIEIQDKPFAREIDEWISIDDQLPDDNMEVLVCTSQDTHFLAWIEDYDWHSIEAIFIQDQVTHWQHLTTPTN